jgi:predicted AAA+ superfamily ATPase
VSSNREEKLNLHLSVLCDRLDRLAILAEVAVGGLRAEDSEWHDAVAYRWRRSAGRFGTTRLVPVENPTLMPVEDLCHVERQSQMIRQNTRQFVMGYAANNVLLTGSRGTGKSSLVKACLHEFSPAGLRLVEVSKDFLDDLPLVFDCLRSRPERFIVFCDDLSFEASETNYKGLKTVLDGTINGPSSNVLIYATSNRRHLLAEDARDNEAYSAESGELHPGDAVEEKISLSDRFGIWITFYPFSQQQYLEVVEQRLISLGLSDEQFEKARPAALQWALSRGGRSGRIATQFAHDFAGRVACGQQ